MKQQKEFDMNKVIFGGLVGGLIGYFIGRIVVDEIWPEYYTEEELQKLQAVTDAYKKVTDHILTPDNKVKGSLVPGRDEVKGQMKVRYDEQWKAENPGSSHLADFANKMNHGADVENEDDQEEFDDEVIEESTDNPRELEYSEYLKVVDSNEPHIISEDDYTVNADDLKKTILVYFDEDDTLVNEEMQPVPANFADRALGEDALFMFGVYANDEDVVHILNPTRNVLYRIVQRHESYKEWIAENTVHENIFKKYNNTPPTGEEEDDDIS